MHVSIKYQLHLFKMICNNLFLVPISDLILKCTYFSDPVDEENYIFDASLLQACSSPKMEPTKMSINNLTHERLVCELAAMEQRLEKYMKEQSEKVLVWEVCS